MKRILAVLWGDDDGDVVLGSAFGVARLFGSRVVGIYVRPPAGEFIPSGDFGMALSQDYLDRLHRESSAKAARLRAAFQEAASRLDIKPGDVGGSDGVSAEWIEAEGSAAMFIGSYGRVFDLIVLRKPDPKISAETEILLEAALFESGRPILVVPNAKAVPHGGTTVVAWNGSTETASVLALGLPLLTKAGKVVIVTIEGGMTPGPTGAEVAQYLACHGITASVRHVQLEGQTTGETFLRETTKLEGDLLFKGAYTQSRLRQLVFGGATRHILSNAQIPVLFAR
ncbi:MAG TPA: universal stress protein [Candidatus Sulfotelmatobacter sp.]|nr:universal stress protein [Candidatus Sulfotelmatobacter sp.]